MSSFPFRRTFCTGKGVNLGGWEAKEEEMDERVSVHYYNRGEKTEGYEVKRYCVKPVGD